VVVNGEEAEVGTGLLAELLVGDTGQAALGVLHDDDGVDAEHMG
jgi:hypothetical protein